MKPALWLLAAAFSLAAQPKLLVNAKTDTRSASAGLEREFKALLASQPQPAWIGYDVPTGGNTGLSCEFVRDGAGMAGIVHLEPPTRAVILFRVEANNVGRIRSLSPDCEIDAGDLPVHWLTGVVPSQSIALLATFVPQREGERNGALTAIAAHSDPAADPVLDRLVQPNQPEWIRKWAAPVIASQRGSHGVETVKSVIANDQSESVKQSAISSLGSNKDPGAQELLIAIARNDRNARLRSAAITALHRKTGQPVLDVLRNAIANDPDLAVRRSAVNALGNLPDGAGVPMLIDLVKTSKDMEVRKQAMNRLQSTHDPRAQAFFEEVLK
jgi:hypothetical protein